MATNFATRYKKDLSTDTLKTKLVRRKSLLQKESRHKEFNKGRQFGPIDVNTQASRENELSRLEETGEEHSPKRRAKLNQMSNAPAKTRGQERMEMLQRYKAEKELRKLKEQREKPIFKCGRFKPEVPAFPKASHIPVLSKPKETVVKTASMEAPPVRVTRSKAKNELQEPVRPQLSMKAPSSATKGYISQIPQQKQKQIYIDKPPRKESKEALPVVSTTSNRRITRAAAAVAKSKIPQVLRPATVTGNLAQKKETNKGKQQRGVKKEEATALHGRKENTFMEPVEKEMTPQPDEATAKDEDPLEKENLPAFDIPAPAPPRKTRSFAPQNFVFKPLEGLTTYKVKPMSPSGANVFLSPNLSWSPTKNTSEVPEESGKETGPKDCDSKYKFFASPEVTEDIITHEVQLPLELPTVEAESVPEEVTEAVPCERKTSLPPADSCTIQVTELAGEGQHDVHYFRNILRSETERLSSQCLEWDGTTETNIPNDAKDLVRTTIGQTRLLIAERFKQFEGLVDNCEFQRGEKETTCTDLDGFWDMVNFQIEDVNKKFENLRKLQGNGWQMEDDVQDKRPCKKNGTRQRATRAGNGAAERAAARKRLAAIKAIMKSKIKQEEQAVSPETPMEGEKVVFDGGFFQIESPAKPFSGRTPKSFSRTPKSASRTPRRISRRTTPRSAAKALLQSCADTCVLRHGTPITSKALRPLPDQDACVNPCEADLLGSISEQSDSQVTEDPCVTVQSIMEEATDAHLAICDERSPLGDQNGLVSDSLESLENTYVEEQLPVAAEEVKQTDAYVNEQDVFCTPKRESQSENKILQAEEQHTPECPLLPDLSIELSCGNGTPDCQPDLEASLFFTPLRNKAQQQVTAATCDNLIVFSPLSLPEEGK